MGLRHTVNRLTLPLWRRVMLMVGRAVLTAVDDAHKLQVLQVRGLSRELLDRVEHFQPYGLTFVPHEGAEAILVCPGGIRQHPIAIAVADRRYRPRGLEPGEICLYTDEDKDAPHRIVFKRGRAIELKAGATTLRLEPAGMTLTTPSGTQTWGTA